MRTDLKSLYLASPVYLREYWTAMHDLYISIYSIPKPVIAEMSGHAIALGCILALCCDHRFTVFVVLIICTVVLI